MYTWYTEDMFKFMYPRVKKSLSSMEYSQQRFRVKHYKVLYKCCILLLL